MRGEEEGKDMQEEKVMVSEWQGTKLEQKLGSVGGKKDELAREAKASSLTVL